MKNNFIIHQHAKQYQWSGDCFLSVKSFYNGHAHYSVGHNAYQVSTENYLILNECTRYDLEINTKKATESFCVFFSPEFVSKVVSECASTDMQLLDFNFNNISGAYFLERKYHHMGMVSSLLLEGKKQLSNTTEKLRVEEYYHRLLNAIITQNEGSVKETEKLALKKKKTRVEIYQRIYCAKEFIDHHYRLDLSLAEIAKAAALSENHLLRCFNQLFGLSPFKYVSKLRIKEACRQIKETDKSISEIARDVGYSSMSNFSHYFKLLTGEAPSRFKSGDI